MNSRLYPIAESDFDLRISPLISSFKNRSGRPPKSSNYEAFCAIFYVLRTGTPWRDLPNCFGKWHTIYTRFKRWSDSGLLWSIIRDCHKNKEATFDMVWLDSTAIKVHRHGAGALKKTECNP